MKYSSRCVKCANFAKGTDKEEFTEVNGHIFFCLLSKDYQISTENKVCKHYSPLKIDSNQLESQNSEKKTSLASDIKRVFHSVPAQTQFQHPLKQVKTT